MAEESDSLFEMLAHERREQITWIVTEFHVSVLTAFFWRIEAPWSLPTRRVDDSFFIFPTDGTVKVTSEGRVHRARRGEFVMLRDNVDHMVELAEGCRQAQWIAIHCHIANVWRVPLLDFFIEPIGRLGNADADLTELAAFVSLFNADSYAGQSWGGQILKNLLVNAVLGGAVLRPRMEDVDPRIGKSLSTIRTKYNRDISVESLAVDSRLSVVQFRKLFKMHTGTSPKDYLVQFRLTVARKLLQESNLSLKKLANDVGFQSVQYFHSVFKRHFNCTPTEFRHRSRRM